MATILAAAQGGDVMEEPESGHAPDAPGSPSPPDKPQVPVGDDGTNPRAPLFFVSYAHAAELKSHYRKPQERNRQVIRFFGDLSDNVAQLVSRPAGADPGYLDRSIVGGAHWTEELLTAIGTCQIFVALLSAPYFASEWCSKEWHAFSRRKVVRLDEGSHADSAPNHQTAIIPIVWAPVHDNQIPAAVGRVQRFSPSGMPNTNITAQYQTYGIFGLLRMRREVAYQGAVWQLAQQIAEFHYSHRVETLTLKEGDLCDIFREQAK
jgi:TIR domain